MWSNFGQKYTYFEPLNKKNSQKKDYIQGLKHEEKLPCLAFQAKNDDMGQNLVQFQLKLTDFYPLNKKFLIYLKKSYQGSETIRLKWSCLALLPKSQNFM